MAYVNCQTCKNPNCPRAGGNFGYTVCDSHVSAEPTRADRIPGATAVDKAAHRVFMAAGRDDDIRWRPSGVKCKECGTELETYYCEERLYAVRCRKCEKVMLVKSRGPGLAAIQFKKASKGEGAT